VESDKEGLETMDDLGKNMAWLIKKLNAGRKKKKTRTKKGAKP
jgi:hypothetical protein